MGLDVNVNGKAREYGRGRKSVQMASHGGVCMRGSQSKKTDYHRPRAKGQGKIPTKLYLGDKG